ncbi:uncharacterized protein CPUR_06850 [Claviceps purpurea 20.1]|uniref:Uncharacterized protein n=1 Tax=Claviceps purpurea (strain 20.1) TaxID=1111077 RepID=M1WIZ7_CLAP2|nr:hypothetical protein E4U28_000135 [Claviceps purpurea]CCE35420.1 uncharacterized protein CPUR_06850 [Claviceps purpurea 20.1]KAG6161689.1 hypothetical protein E4U11_003215 [Claviceps purpurea]KAG6163277.1 hypothetical protein E4U51_005829 [Claviceps purpurea]KAG6181580.1 hypothetical protein E4U36_003975 [Claviceps purpurea]
MASVYKQFLASPSSSYLADRASLHYVTTTTSVYGSTEIIKHLNTLQKQVKIKKQDLLNLVDGQSVIAAEFDTVLEFQTSGGAYLPGLDDNFLSDRVAYLSITHIVTFDEEGKILQIRQQWDQGSLLKQMDVIGKSGRNWPIRDGRQQLTLIQSCLKSGGLVNNNNNNTKPESHNDLVLRTRGNSNNAMRDPHASLQLFGNREELEAADSVAVVSPYAGKQRRGERSFTDVLGDDPSGEHYGGGRHSLHTSSPSKAGQGKNFQPMRIFEGQEYKEEEDQTMTPKSKNTFIRPHPRKYNHFDLADGSDPQDKPKPGVSNENRPKSKHDSQWDFQDFSTPSKHLPTKQLRPQEARGWDTEADKEANQATQAQPCKGRRDAEAHFELQDDGERLPHQDRPNARPRGSMQNDNMSLYKNKLFEPEHSTPEAPRALGNITNLGGRGKDFDPHFAMADESPAPAAGSRHQHVPESRMKAVKQMDANWSSYDQSPVSHKENKQHGEGKFLDDNKINIAGDGMGGRKGTNRDWLYGDTDCDTPKPASRKANPSAAQKSFWDY